MQAGGVSKIAELSAAPGVLCLSKSTPGETMKRILFAFAVGMIVLSACAGPAANVTPAPAETTVPALPSETAAAPAPTETAAPLPKLPAPSFEAQTYINETVGFALEYPAGWTVNEMVIGERGTQIQFLSAPEVADMPVVAGGATRVNATIYQWDPKNDLAAYVAHWKSAWEASGFTLVEEQPLTLELGLPAVQYTIQTPDADVVFLVTAIGDRYLVLSGEGDLELVKEIVQRVRPIS
jgi:hypothetical protein